MDGYIKAGGTIWSHLLASVLIAGFFLVFTLIYHPMEVVQTYDALGGMGFSFHLLMVSIIIMLTLFVTRVIYFFAYSKVRMLWWKYAIWCFSEVIIASLFSALYTWLFKKPDIGYFEAVSYCFKLLSLSLVFPYILHVLYLIIRDQNEQINDMNSPSWNASPIKFTDEHGRLKLVIDASEILYLNSLNNYVKVYYLEAGSVKEFSLRNSMKNIEKFVYGHGIVRCHRSYFLNPMHVKVLRKDKYGFVVAEFNIPEVNPIPISKNYYEAIADMM